MGCAFPVRRPPERVLRHHQPEPPHDPWLQWLWHPFDLARPCGLSGEDSTADDPASDRARRAGRFDRYRQCRRRRRPDSDKGLPAAEHDHPHRCRVDRGGLLSGSADLPGRQRQQSPAAEEHMTMASFTEVATFHYANDVAAIMGGDAVGVTGGFGDSFLEVADFAYTFQPFFHPFVGQLIKKLNQTDVAGMLDPGFLATLLAPYSPSDYSKIQAG